ncbi:uncharacterized protein EI90DRAFT_299800 [Cantharellus anzutake]|uniref:uncharacterized protein n=1 Tax=Cantharellus anzutake TaxID=1750568 RepID=UPI0019050F49|nr:uncharacterized protein EI90DRAFT_299800 [Cantharellus anzutake]KAF8315789.1 hypothetical protein EI90DRAFT_299800 [Cantharellus anzutake]
MPIVLSTTFRHTYELKPYVLNVMRSILLVSYATGCLVLLIVANALICGYLMLLRFRQALDKWSIVLLFLYRDPMVIWRGSQSWTAWNLFQVRTVLRSPEGKPYTLECPICFEEMDTERAPTTGAPCGHVLCQVCRAQIVKYARNGPTCHACRMPYDSPETSG